MYRTCPGKYNMYCAYSNKHNKHRIIQVPVIKNRNFKTNVTLFSVFYIFYENAIGWRISCLKLKRMKLGKNEW